MGTDPYNPWPHRLAVLTAGATVLLIFVGGLVTNTGSALAVPDWPTTFGYNMFLYPWSRMVGGIFYEHSHRLIGSAVGMLTIACAACVWRFDGRTWVRRLALGAVVAVVVQGILGGLRVVLLEHGLAIVHGCFAQAFFALMMSIVVCTSAWWRTVPGAASLTHGSALRQLAVTTALLVYLQIVFGALLTHLGRLDTHLVGAGAVTIAIAWLSARVLIDTDAHAELRRPAALLLALLGVQISLGFGAYLWRFTQVSQAMSTALGLSLQATHRITGTGILGTAVVLALRVARMTRMGQTLAQPARDAHDAVRDAVAAPAGRQVLA